MAYEDQSIIPINDNADDLGSPDKRWRSISCVTLICGNITQTGSTLATGPDSETKTGIVIDETDNKISIPSNFENAITFEGEITTQAVTRIGNHIDLDTYKISGDGGSSGFGMSGANATIDGTLTVTGKAIFNKASPEAVEINGPVDVNSTVDISGTLTVGGAVDINANVDISGTLTMSGNNIILSGEYISNDGDNEGIAIANDGDVTCTDNLYVTNIMQAQSNIITTGGIYVCQGNSGVTTTIDFSTYSGTITITGGLITNVP